MSELKPCPFCGGKAKKYSDFTYTKLTGATLHYIGCMNCGNRSAPRLSWNETIEKWNKRIGDKE